MSQKRRNHSPEFNAKVPLAAARGGTIMSELTELYNVQPSQIATWKSELIDNATSLFSGEASKEKQVSEEVDRLHSKTSQLTMENDLLAKVLGR